MQNEYTQALSEIDEILKFLDYDLLKKIPMNFRKFISQMKDKDYKFKYNEELTLEEQKLKPETKAILSIMYRDYFCTPEEREKIIQEDKEELRKIEKEKQEKYNVENMFKKETLQKGAQEQPMAMTIVEEKENFITKIFNAIKRIFMQK